MVTTALACPEPGPLGSGSLKMHFANNGLEKPLSKCSNKELGNYGEGIAARYLQSCGYTIIERNWRCTFGEVDIVAESDSGTAVLVEVKTRVVDPGNTDIVPELAVNYRKRNRYQKLALVYLSTHSRVATVRFDVVSVRLTGENEACVRHYPCAYEWDD